MAAFRKSKYLTCFYCGRRTPTRHDAHVKHFDCPNCDATNYLDENGEITDPPVATSKVESPPQQYALSRPSATSSTTSSSQIFCETCLKNQHLFTSSLAQYLPDDPDHPEYAERERGYYKFRKNLEQRYPQLCADCKPKVLDQIEKAGYTAKTDHLRRMIDRSTQVRTTPALSLVNIVDTAGRLLWVVGLVLQLLWHTSIMCNTAIAEQSVDEKKTWTLQIVRAAGLLFRLLPSPDRLINWSITASLLSIWWNPKLVQTVRGFTKHLVGLSTWYSFQVAVIILKIGIFTVWSMPKSQEAQTATQIGAHSSMALFMIFIYNLARRSIRVDTTPLFGPAPKRPQLQQAQQPREIPGPQEVASKQSMSDILDDILKESTPKPSTAIARFSGSNTYGQSSTYRSSYNPTTAAISGNPFRSNHVQQRPSSSELTFDSLNLSEQHFTETRQVTRDEDAMDWSPTQSKHRAFNTQGQTRHNRGFGATPTDSKAKPIWYKVPPAPVTPAQRLFNPPNAPRIRTSPLVKEPVHFRGSATVNTLSSFQPERPQERVETAFAEPSFFVRPQDAPEADALSDLFGRSFSLNPSQEEERHQGRRDSQTRISPSIRNSGSPAGQLVETMALVACLAGWLHATMSQHEYAMQVTVAILLVCVTISARINGSTLKNAAEEQGFGWTEAIGTVLGIGEIAFACQIAMRMWGTSGDCATCHSQGGWLIGTMLAHQVWNLVF